MAGPLPARLQELCWVCSSANGGERLSDAALLRLVSQVAVSDFNPTNPQQLGEFLHREFWEAAQARRLEDYGALRPTLLNPLWGGLTATERACWTDTARALLERLSLLAPGPGSGR